MKPRLVQLTMALLVSVGALAACRKEVQPPMPAPDRTPTPKVDAGMRSAALWLVH
ncbi:hypothetical protein [Roseateles sp. LYH14W]|uniref:Uncharacterized protein n=1 Tax=Pelomonas parva TaxID=3299032 RepID=A0ABW7F7M2_9BURK